MEVKTNLQTLASALQARENCRKSGNDEWFQKWDETIRAVMSNAPSGSGFDSGTDLEEEKCTPNKLVFSTSYHHMNDNGMYCGWTEHVVTVTPAFVGFDLKVSGRNRNEIKDYIGDIFYEWLSEEVPEWVQNLHVAKAES